MVSSSLDIKASEKFGLSFSKVSKHKSKLAFKFKINQ